MTPGVLGVIRQWALIKSFAVDQLCERNGTGHY